MGSCGRHRVGLLVAAMLGRASQNLADPDGNLFCVVR